MRAIVLILAALIFGALLLFDTTALIQLSWLCLTGRCGIPVGWIGWGLGALILVGVLLAVPNVWRRRGKPARGRPAKAKPRATRRKRAKP